MKKQLAIGAWVLTAICILAALALAKRLETLNREIGLTSFVLQAAGAPSRDGAGSDPGDVISYPLSEAGGARPVSLRSRLKTLENAATRTRWLIVGTLGSGLIAATVGLVLWIADRERKRRRSLYGRYKRDRERPRLTSAP